MTSAILPLRSISYILCPSISAAVTQKPLSLSSSMVDARFVTFATGVYSSAPADVFITTLLTPALSCLGIITPCAPTQFAVLIIAPRLCGSVILSQMITNGLSPFSSAFSRMSFTDT